MNTVGCDKCASGEIGYVWKVFGNSFGGVQVFQKSGTGVPGAVEVLALGTGLDLQLDGLGGGGDGGGGDVDR